jgi:hypothetical protein
MSSSSSDVIDAECFCFSVGCFTSLLSGKKRKLIMLISSTSFTCLPHLPDIKRNNI